jgi:hypothetical protein
VATHFSFFFFIDKGQEFQVLSTHIIPDNPIMGGRSPQRCTCVTGDMGAGAPVKSIAFSMMIWGLGSLYEVYSLLMIA